jgi:eukaryotic-like serine/threonine-protein kinase
MREEATAELVDLLARLHLATRDQVQSVRGRARRLAGDLPLFDSVWIDALVQAKLLTPYQASEINAGRGERLRVGPFVIHRLLQRLGYADCFVAVEGESKGVVHLVVVRNGKRIHAADPSPQPSPARGEGAGMTALQAVVVRFATVKLDSVPQLQSAGGDGSVIWAAYTPAAGFPISDWLACQGRLQPAATLEVARQMAAAMAALEAAAIVHGDLAASSLWLNEAGMVQLSRCGVRGIVWPNEIDESDVLPPELFDYLAPERLSGSLSQRERESSAATVSSDLFAFGCLCWHMLTGRTPFAGGDSELKRRAIQQSRIADVRSIAPDVSTMLAELIDCCTRRDLAERPQSFAEAVERLGPPTAAGRRQLVSALLESGRSTLRPNWHWEMRRTSEQIGKPALASAACLLLLAAAMYPLWKSRPQVHDRTVLTASVGGDSRRRLDTPKNPATEVSHSRPEESTVVAGSSNSSVHLANYQTPAETQSPPSVKPTPAPSAPILQLPAASEIAGATLRLQPGAIVRGTSDQRPRVRTPANGLIIAADNVRFENIDFVWRQRPEEIVSPERHAMIDLRAPHVQFVGCTFQAVSAGTFELPVAIRCSGSSQITTTLALALQVQLERCVLDGVSCGVECRTRAPLAIAAKNTLYLGRGPLMRFPTGRPVDAPATLQLDGATIRGARAVVELNCDDAGDGAAPLTITAGGCVFAPEERGALVVFTGGRSPPAAGGFLKSIEWSGQGSLISAGANVVLWRHAEISEPLPEAELSVDGLATSTLEFEGLASGDPAKSRLRRWLGPVSSDEPPGIGENLPQLPDVVSGRTGE